MTYRSGLLIAVLLKTANAHITCEDTNATDCECEEGFYKVQGECIECDGYAAPKDVPLECEDFVAEFRFATTKAKIDGSWPAMTLLPVTMYYLASRITSMLESRHIGFKYFDASKKRKAVKYVIKLPIAIAIYILSIPILVKAIVNISDEHWIMMEDIDQVLWSGVLLCTFYIFELMYDYPLSAPVALHHIMTCVYVLRGFCSDQSLEVAQVASFLFPFIARPTDCFGMLAYFLCSNKDITLSLLTLMVAMQIFGIVAQWCCVLTRFFVVNNFDAWTIVCLIGVMPGQVYGVYSLWGVRKHAIKTVKALKAKQDRAVKSRRASLAQIVDEEESIAKDGVIKSSMKHTSVMGMVHIKKEVGGKRKSTIATQTDETHVKISGPMCANGQAILVDHIRIDSAKKEDAKKEESRRVSNPSICGADDFERRGSKNLSFLNNLPSILTADKAGDKSVGRTSSCPTSPVSGLPRSQTSPEVTSGQTGNVRDVSAYLQSCVEANESEVNRARSMSSGSQESNLEMPAELAPTPTARPFGDNFRKYASDTM